ncbi:hypothetical protein [Jidongwangia harbinensis]|uniref:hypothetical protein n=1 Tax=Jidongwangia harbinensis TaxID=2878561 RepID=UPI001CD9F80B|nr:hypothetical protein [Jidongwangia harbinensis]MCA2215933.1 hypothetical protein [Jidongwangia harbinensis]
MNDLEELRDALHTPPGFTPRALDLDAVMTAGGRLRRRRRLATGAGAALAVAALLVGGGQMVGGGAVPDRPGDAPAAARPEVSTPGRPADMLGDPVPTGLPAGTGEYVLYGRTIDDDALPDTTFGMMLAVRGPAGDLTDRVIANEVVGPDTAPGFHAVQGANGPGEPTFGYYVGPATRITAKYSGRTVTAKQARWSADARVIFFWFAPTDGQLKMLTAYDADGKKLPAGHNVVGVG